MAFKRMKVMDSIDDSQSKSKHAAIAGELGREVRVFTKSAVSLSSDLSASSNAEGPDDFYDFSPDDYYHIISNKIGAKSQVLKTRKIREAEARARMEKLTKATIRVHFPDNYILEAEFQPSEKIHSLVDLLTKVVARQDLPFYLYTTPPKERIKDMSKDFYSAGFAPGAIVYFSYDLPKVADDADANLCPYLREEVLSCNQWHHSPNQDDVAIPEPVPARVPTPALSEPNPATKKTAKPKWFKL